MSRKKNDIKSYPKNTYPLQAFDWNNYLLACSNCNSNYKRSEFPLDINGKPLLINPVEEDPRQHIAFSPRTGRYSRLNDKGSESIRVYGLNRSTLTIGRRDAWVSVQVHIIQYGRRLANGSQEESRRIKEVICRFPHAGVFIALLDIIESPFSHTIVMQKCIQTIRQYPEIKTWMT